MLSGDLQRFLNEINSENNISDINICDDITFIIIPPTFVPGSI